MSCKVSCYFCLFDHVMYVFCNHFDYQMMLVVPLIVRFDLPYADALCAAVCCVTLCSDLSVFTSIVMFQLFMDSTRTLSTTQMKTLHELLHQKSIQSVWTNSEHSLWWPSLRPAPRFHLYTPCLITFSVPKKTDQDVEYFHTFIL